MKCKVCGNNEFFAHQIVRMDVICDGEGRFTRDIDDDPAANIYDAEKPYGPFTCTVCGAEYDELSEQESISTTAKDDAVRRLWRKLVNALVHPDAGRLWFKQVALPAHPALDCLILSESVGPFHTGDSYETVRKWFDANYSGGFEALLALL